MTDSYRHLRYEEREALAKMRDAAIPVSEIAARLGRHRSTLYRELRRNFMHDEEAWFRGYFPNVAHKRARRRRAPGRKLERNIELAADVVQGLRRRWSPEQIAGRMRVTAQQPRVSHETIYQYVYGAEGRRQGYPDCCRGRVVVAAFAAVANLEACRSRWSTASSNVHLKSRCGLNRTGIAGGPNS
jgi:IS30 family transposase